MKDKTVMVVMHPRDRVWEALCERTCDLARFLDHVEKAELQSRETTPQGLVRCVHVWRARPSVPAILAHHLDSKLMEWTARTEWRINEYESRWVIEPKWRKNAILCEGTMRFAPAIGGRATRVELELAISDDQGPAGFQAIAGAILSTHFRSLVDAAKRLIDQE